jgi:hypothetical protein
MFAGEAVALGAGMLYSRPGEEWALQLVPAMEGFAALANSFLTGGFHA